MFKTHLLPPSKKFRAEYHGFHLVSPSPWPFLVSMSMLNVILWLVTLFHDMKVSSFFVVFSWVYLMLNMGMWFSDVVIEATFQGHHTSFVQSGLSLGMLLFLLSETMFFFGFFWCFFYVSIAPSIWIGCTWPPMGMEPLDPTKLPLLNTVILVSSGISANFAHKSMLRSNGSIDVMIGLGYSIVLGIAFTCFQLWEYSMATFSINDGIYGSIFYVATGFHGLHVIIGTVALIVCLMSHMSYHFQMEHHLGLEFSIWYWHFVDIIWILLYLSIYCWGYSWN